MRPFIAFLIVLRSAVFIIAGKPCEVESGVNTAHVSCPFLHTFSAYRLVHLNLACGGVACLMLPLLLVALYTMRKEQHGPIPTTRANVELHQETVTPQQESSSQLRYSDQEYEADDHCRLNQCLKVWCSYTANCYIIDPQMGYSII